VRINPHHRYRVAIERRMFESARLRAVICNSRMVKDDIATRFRVEPSRLTVIYNAVASDVFSPALRSHRPRVRLRHRIPEHATAFLHVGSGFERKGVATAIDALAKLPPPAHLIVVGRDKHAGRYEARARERGVARRVTFTGPLADPRPYYGAADAFVLPTLYDPCPNAALEALACGLPVITSTKSGAAEIVLDNDAGLVSEARDVEALAAAMHRLEDDELRARMGANARTAALRLTPASMTLALVLLYRDLLAASVAARDAGPAHRSAPDPASARAEIVPPPAMGDAAAELSLGDRAPARPVADASPPTPTPEPEPPELGDGLPGRDPRAG
jgi:UDP-glucose:(heptosyl)LPS alpha-1,3-glucosyltransferase